MFVLRSAFELRRDDQRFGYIMATYASDVSPHFWCLRSETLPPASSVVSNGVVFSVEVLPGRALL